MPEIGSKNKNIRRWLERPDHPAIAPVELAGTWVAWDWKQTKIIAHGDSMTAVDAAALATGCRYVLQKLPSTNVQIPLVRMADALNGTAS